MFKEYTKKFDLCQKDILAYSHVFNHSILSRIQVFNNQHNHGDCHNSPQKTGHNSTLGSNNLDITQSFSFEILRDIIRNHQL